MLFKFFIFALKISYFVLYKCKLVVFCFSDVSLVSCGLFKGEIIKILFILQKQISEKKTKRRKGKCKVTHVSWFSAQVLHSTYRLKLKLVIKIM